VASVDPTEARCANIEGGRQRSAARLSSGAKCRTAKPGQNRDGASGGNCTCHPVYATHWPQICYALSRGDAQKTCREDESFRELVANWHGQTPDVRAAIMEFVRGGG